MEQGPKKEYKKHIAIHAPEEGDGRGSAVNEVTLRAVEDSIPRATAFIDSLLKERNGSPKAINALNVMLDEILINIVRYAYAEGCGDMTLRFAFDEARRMASIDFIDRGIAFDPLTVAEPDVTAGAEDRKIGGLGIFLVKKLADSVQYCREEGANILTVRKYVGTA